MAKKNSYDPYRSQQEAIRKAKGNPNKNLHHKKNNSNYGGKDYLKEKTELKASQQRKEQVKLPLWLKITLGVLFALLITSLILRLTTFKDAPNALLDSSSSLLLGLACGALFYIRRFLHKKKEGKVYNIITLALAVFCVVYGCMGIIGLVNALNIA